MVNMLVTALIATCAVAGANTFGTAPVTYNPASIVPAYGASYTGSTAQSGYSTGNTNSYDTSSYLGTANNYGNQVTNYGSIGSNYANQATAISQFGQSLTQYSAATTTPGYGPALPAYPAATLPNLYLPPATQPWYLTPPK